MNENLLEHEQRQQNPQDCNNCFISYDSEKLLPFKVEPVCFIFYTSLKLLATLKQAFVTLFPTDCDVRAFLWFTTLVSKSGGEPCSSKQATLLHQPNKIILPFRPIKVHKYSSVHFPCYMVHLFFLHTSLDESYHRQAAGTHVGSWCLRFVVTSHHEVGQIRSQEANNV